MAKWIKVEDKLPHLDGIVFAWGKQVMELREQTIYLAFYNELQDQWYVADRAQRLCGVTHWRHMIKPPREA